MSVVALLAVAGADAVGVAHADEAELRVCADPDNLPYSDTNGTGFENRIAKLVADDLGAKLTYTWYPQRRGFVRRTLNERVCDVMIGVPTALDLVRTTKPYYRSQYVFVYPAASSHAYASLDDPALTSARIAVSAESLNSARRVCETYASTGVVIAMATKPTRMVATTMETTSSIMLKPRQRR